jgi:hypothetical protein
MPVISSRHCSVGAVDRTVNGRDLNDIEFGRNKNINTSQGCNKYKSRYRNPFFHSVNQTICVSKIMNIDLLATGY